jgi:hypothetical protein
MSNFDLGQHFTDLPSAETVAQEKISAADAAAAAAELRADAERKIGLKIQKAYADRFIDAAEAGIQKLIEKNWKWIRIFPNLGIFSFTRESDSKNVITPFDDVHYGGGKINKSFTKRFKNPNYHGLFRHVQKCFLDKGYILLDESDPGKGFGMFFILYMKDHYDMNREVENLWHGYNRLV